ncbi:uncharacterized protein LOC114331187 isoform X2 [Diabrotica virgifera virgifera]|uniref:Secreted protein n=1 Tax=Diabrotica virgifera virgifera TaxID=50390 RepID=A0ABM5IMH6_DIAVI|nr:uncharacterized protein LOC114331187 isoform X2 [Diabrotica virgifera virgifera]
MKIFGYKREKNLNQGTCVFKTKKMKLNLIVIAFAICIYGVQSHAVPGSSEISPESAQALLNIVKKLLEESKNPVHVQKKVIEKTQTLKNKLEITHSERSLIPDLQYLVALILNGLGDVVRLLLPPGQDLYHVIAKGLQKVVRWFVHDNEPLLELLDKLIVAGENIARVAINSAIRILLGQPLVTFIV